MNPKEAPVPDVEMAKKKKKKKSSKGKHHPKKDVADLSGGSIPDVVIHKLLDRKNFANYKDLQNSECKAPDHFDSSIVITLDEMNFLVDNVRELISSEPYFGDMAAPCTVVGDLHGQFRDFLLTLDCINVPPTMNYLFLGDYVDRGEYSLECIALIMSYKLKYPKNVIMLRGNHEAASSTRAYGFYLECNARYPGKDIWQRFIKLFNMLPVAATLANKKVLCMHGGLSPDLHNLDDILKLKRPSDIPPRGILTDLVWADPDKDEMGWNPNIDRGISHTFGADIVSKFTKKHGLSLIVRAHQVVKNGFEFFAKRKLCTLFTAPNYCGVFKNDGGCMKIEPNDKGDINVTVIRLFFKNKESLDVNKRCESMPVDLDGTN